MECLSSLSGQLRRGVGELVGGCGCKCIDSSKVYVVAHAKRLEVLTQVSYPTFHSNLSRSRRLDQVRMTDIDP